MCTCLCAQAWVYVFFLHSFHERSNLSQRKPQMLVSFYGGLENNSILNSNVWIYSEKRGLLDWKIFFAHECFLWTNNNMLIRIKSQFFERSHFFFTTSFSCSSKSVNFIIYPYLIKGTNKKERERKQVNIFSLNKFHLDALSLYRFQLVLKMCFFYFAISLSKELISWFVEWQHWSNECVQWWLLFYIFVIYIQDREWTLL